MIIIGAILILVVLFFTVSLTRLYRSIAQYKTYWNHQAAQTAPDNALYYVALGDSAAQGIGASSPQKGYVGLITIALGQSANRPVHVINLSVTGARTKDVITTQIPELQKLKLPKDAVITVEIGANDMVDAFNPETFRVNLETIYAKLPSQTVVADIPYFGGSRFRSKETNVKQANVIIHEVAQQYKLSVAPLHNTTSAGTGWSDAADFFHPNNRGYRNWYKAFWSVLDTANK
jgi:acyl-CoA thioesterase-1